ncbi:MAG: flagellar protein FlgN [Bacillota bacterium]
MNSQKISDLINVLDQEARIYEDILKISKNKTDIIIKGKVSELENITKLEQSLILKMGKLENIRESLVGEISALLNINPSEITVSELLKYLDNDQAKRLQAYRDSMADMLKELKNTNELNSKLIKNSIDYIDFSINILSNTQTDGNNYSKSGQVREAKKKTYFDVKL